VRKLKNGVSERCPRPIGSIRLSAKSSPTQCRITRAQFRRPYTPCLGTLAGYAVGDALIYAFGIKASNFCTNSKARRACMACVSGLGKLKNSTTCLGPKSSTLANFSCRILIARFTCSSSPRCFQPRPVALTRPDNCPDSNKCHSCPWACLGRRGRELS
jgi:hypothetical protein